MRDMPDSITKEYNNQKMIDVLKNMFVGRDVVPFYWSRPDGEKGYSPRCIHKNKGKCLKKNIDDPYCKNYKEKQ